MEVTREPFCMETGGLALGLGAGVRLGLSIICSREADARNLEPLVSP